MDSTYGQFCPVAMAADIVCSRWTLLVIRELMCGSTRFNDLRRGVPRMSPALLSKRLKELEHAGIVRVAPTAHAGVSEYRLTEAGEDLRGVVMGLGTWGQRWIETELTLRNLDPVLLMWDMRRHINPTPLPTKRCTINFVYPDLPESKQNYWLVVDKGEVDLCWVDPGFDIDLYVSSALRTMTAIWMGHSDIRAEIDAGRLEVSGDRGVAQSMERWLSLSPFAAEKNRRAAAA
jgi:DNA-binding HxlR family transcriptional regulator